MAAGLGALRQESGSPFAPGSAGPAPALPRQQPTAGQVGAEPPCLPGVNLDRTFLPYPRCRRARIRPTCSSAPGPAASSRVARAKGERTIASRIWSPSAHRGSPRSSHPATWGPWIANLHLLSLPKHGDRPRLAGNRLDLPGTGELRLRGGQRVVLLALVVALRPPVLESCLAQVIDEARLLP